jgi:hypothetical protein
MDKMNDSISTPVDILDQLAAQMPMGGAGDVLMLPLSPTPQPEQDQEQEDDQSQQPEQEEDDQQDQQDQPPPSTPPRPIPELFEPPAVLRRRRTSGGEDDNDHVEDEYVPALRANAIEAWQLTAEQLAAEQLTEPPSPASRQIGRSITPVTGEQAVPPVCFMSDTEGEETDREEAEDGYEQDTEVEEEEETTQLGGQGDGLVVTMPFWLFGLTIAAMTLYLTFVIYLLSWECRFPIVQRH